jgi:uncharacterized cupredoxin-like copper-binding protein
MSTRTLAALAATLILGVSSAFAEEAESHHDGGEHGEPGHHDAAAADDNDGGHHGDAGHHGDGMAMMIGEPGNAADAARTVEISMVDNFFEPESLAFAAGETIRFVVTNDGSVVHEFNIGTAAMHAAHQEEMMMMVEHGAIEIDRINHEMMNMDMDGHVMSHDDPNAILLEPGDSGEVIWKFTQTTALEFACNVPGHYDSGMMGDISVTP